MHSHLNHLSCNLCRGLLEFAEERPLGKSGLHWLKIHLTNLYVGDIEKLSYDERLAFVENRLHDIFDYVDNLINGYQWWLGAKDPFQCLAACINLPEAIEALQQAESRFGFLLVISTRQQFNWSSLQTS
ncbi:hypothetical protein V8G54_024960 [Vigna mungo]|uniref:DNA-directed RNA polymerase n=1 Tax=Vigna mungo TaxID=3915 RepID=A0AAQ3N6V7_VIGMU